MPPKRSFKKTQKKINSTVSKPTISLNKEATEFVPETLSEDSFKTVNSYEHIDEFPEPDLIETDNCSELSNTHIVDLDLLTMSDRNMKTRGSVLTESKYLDLLPGLIKYGDIELPIVEYMSDGTYGSVFKYSDETILPNNYIIQRSPEGISYVEKLDLMTYSEPTFKRPRKPEDKVHSVAIKVFKNKLYELTRENFKKAKLYSGEFEIGGIITIKNKFFKILGVNKNKNVIIQLIDREILLVEDLSKLMDRELCNSVNAKLLTLNNNIENEEVTCVAMELMDGTLNDLEFESIEKNFAILQGIARLLQCLINHNLSYSDLKTQNLLYKCYDNNKMKIVLGDLGSIFTLDSEELSPCTFPPCDLVNEKTKHNTETAMVWQLGVVFIQLLKDDIYYKFHHSEAKKLTTNLNNTLDDIIKNNSLENYKINFNDDYGINEIDLGLLLKYMLDGTSANRIKMYEIIEAELL